MQVVRASRTVTVMVLALAIACSKSPTSPTPPPPAPTPTPTPTPVGSPPSITCGPSLSRGTTNAAGMTLTFDTPAVSGGEGSVRVECAPSSGATFPIGTTQVSCTATDTLNRTASCTFNVTVARIPQLSRTRFLAFGDSITAGEVTFPIGSLRPGGELSTRLVVVPSAAYPTILAKLLQARYTAQEDSIIVANYGLGGEKAINARDRFLAALNTVRPEAVLLMEGHNDVSGGQDGAASGAANEIRIMADQARSRGMRVFIATLVPPRPNGNRTIGQIYIEDYNNRMRVVASQTGSVLVDVYAALLPGVTTYVGVDGLHPTEAGYAKIAETFFTAIQNTLEVR